MLQFYRCISCGNFVVFLEEKGRCTPKCCGEEMEEIVPNSLDASQEKHVPDVTVDGDKVKVNVGTAPHPMAPEHFIMWVILETDKGFQKKDLKPGDDPVATFVLTDGEKPVTAYAFCNQHGLWKKDL